MTKYVSSHDLAAAMLFVSSSETLKKTFGDLIMSIAKSYPKLRGGRQLHSEFWAEGNVYWGWFNFAKPVKRPTSKPYVGVGVCFEIPALYAADSASLPAHEPFFLVLCGDDWFDEKPDVFLTAIPEGWVTIEEGQTIAAVRPVRQFPADPDERFEAVKNWAATEVGKLVACIPGYADAPTESAPAVEDDA